MVFKIKELKQFLSSVTKHKIENIHIQSQDLQLTINTIKNRKKILSDITSNSKAKDKLTNNQRTSNNNLKKNITTVAREKSKYFTIVSPMIGTFYRSPAPNEAPFIDINDTVKINQTVCIIEAMKLMNEIESEVNGNIVEILVEDGDIVDCGQALIRVKQQ